MKTILLKEFILTGDFDRIEVGVSTKADLISLMGESHDFADCGDTQIIKYGWWEFFYWTEDNVVFAFQNDHLQFDCTNHEEFVTFENQLVKIDTWFIQPNKNIRFSEIIEHLKAEGIEYSFEKYDFEGALEYIRLSNGITIDFVPEEITWEIDESTGECTCSSVVHENQADFVLNGVRLFRY
jgi:hypothetical protein